MDEGLSRRELLKKVGLGGAVFLGGSVLGHTVQHQAQAAGDDYTDPGAIGHSALDGGATPAPYGHMHVPPEGMGSTDLDHQTFPPKPDGRPAGSLREIEIAVEERLIEVGEGVHVPSPSALAGRPRCNGVVRRGLSQIGLAALDPVPDPCRSIR